MRYKKKYQILKEFSLKLKKIDYNDDNRISGNLEQAGNDDMNTVGMIAEFNPFHNGHKYLIEQAKKITGAKNCVVIMSGNYVQRGEPAIIDKYKRARCALLGGADVVLELPVRYSCASAKDFAYGAVSLLGSLDCITHLAFGAENPDIDVLKNVASALSDMNMEQDNLTGALLRQGLSYPLALSRSFPDHKDILDKPNNILAIEYIRALNENKSSIIPVAVQRKGDHNDDNLNDDKLNDDDLNNDNLTENTGICSSTAIRKNMRSDYSNRISGFIPDFSYEILKECIKEGITADINDFSDYINFRLFELKKECVQKSDFVSKLTDYHDMDRDLASKLYNISDERLTVSEICERLKSKNYTRARINRALLHFMLSIKDTSFCKEAAFIRLLGLKKEAGFLLKNSKSYIISKPADALSQLKGIAFDEYRSSLFCDDLYYMQRGNKRQNYHKELTSNINLS